MIDRDIPIYSGGMKASLSRRTSGLERIPKKKYDKKYPINILRYDKIRRGALHPTQKPEDLCQYLIETYTTEDMLVLDNAIGSEERLPLHVEEH